MNNRIEDDYSQLKIRNWYLKIKSIAKHVISVNVYDESNCICCDIYSDGTARTTADVYRWLINVLYSVNDLQKAAEKNGYNFSATMEGFTFEGNYTNDRGVIDLLNADNCENIIYECTSGLRMLDAIAELDNLF